MQVERAVKAVMVSKRNRNKKLKLLGDALPFILPGIILVSVFVLYAVFFNIRISLSNYKVVGNQLDFLGLDNFISLFKQERFWLAYRNNFLYALVTAPSIMLFGLISAVLINSISKGRVFFRVAFYLPVLTSWVIVGLVFLYLFNQGQYGFVNYVFKDIFHILPDYVGWTQGEWTANFVIWVMGIWKNIGWCMVVYIAALQGIPYDMYEAAVIEGANAIHKFIKITIPMIKGTTYFVLVNLIIGSFNVFIQVLLLTKGNPAGRTSVLQYMLYDKTFNLFQFGEGAAIGVLTAVTVFILSILLNRKKEEF